MSRVLDVSSLLDVTTLLEHTTDHKSCSLFGMVKTRQELQTNPQVLSSGLGIHFLRSFYRCDLAYIP